MNALSALRPFTQASSTIRFAQQGPAQPQAHMGIPTLFACEACGGKGKQMEGKGGFMHEHGGHALMGLGLVLVAGGLLLWRRLSGKGKTNAPQDSPPPPSA